MTEPPCASEGVCGILYVFLKPKEGLVMEDTYLKFLKRPSAKEIKRAQRWEAIKEIVGMIAFTGIMFVFCALCVCCSGYHWE